MKQILLFIAIILIALNGFAQEITEEEVIEENQISKKKMYKDNIYASFADWTFYPGKSEGEGADIIYGSSHNFTYGMSYLRNLSSIFGAGVGIHYQYQAFHIKQNETKLIPNSIINDSEILKMNNLGVDAAIRLTLKRELKKTLIYLELGGYGNWMYNAKHQVENNIDLTNLHNGSSKQTTIYDGLNYIEPINYGLTAKFGYKMFSLIGSYRLSDYFVSDFKENISETELPRLTVGIQFSSGR